MRHVLTAGLLCAAVTATLAADGVQHPFFGQSVDPAALRRSIPATPLPANKRYADLTPEERAVLKSDWLPMPESDEPPFPARGLRPLYDGLIKAQARLLVEGALSVVARVGPTGEVEELRLIQSPSPEMTQAVGAMLFDTRFKPAVCGGQACTMEYPFRFVFKVD